MDAGRDVLRDRVEYTPAEMTSGVSFHRICNLSRIEGILLLLSRCRRSPWSSLSDQDTSRDLHIGQAEVS